MDQNKLHKLREIGFKIQPTCRSCRHSDLKGEWGVCQIQTYFHLKHKEPRQLSIFQDGHCDKWSGKDLALGAWEELRGL